jgi:hypothetical protein
MKTSNMKFTVRIISMFLLVSVAILALDPPAATCTGSDPCHACKNCKYCKHCAKEGGTCGVCKDRT